MLDHSDLVAEITQVEKMTTPERLKHAKKRRSQQLKAFANYEKQLEKEKNKKNKGSQNQKRPHRKKARVKFVRNIMLLEAAARNDVEEVRKLLMAGVSPDETNEDGLTALHQCCIDDSEDMLKLLLEFGANVNARDSEMWTPLHAAAICGHVHLCKLLIDKGAELLAVNVDGNMPYDICEDEVCLDFIETEMAKRGITQEEIDEKRLETERKMLEDLKKMASAGRDLEFRDRNRATPLHIAAANGYLEVVEFLLNHNVSMEVRDEDGWLPIHAAACWLQPEVIEMLVKRGADLDAKTRGGETPFDLAEQPDVKQKILDLKDEIETHWANKSKEHVRNRRPINTRGASIRRTSMRNEKKPLFKKEAKEEALHFGLNVDNDDDDDTPNMDDHDVPATNIDDVKISLVDDTEKHQRETSEKHKVDKADTGKKVVVATDSNKMHDSQKQKDNTRVHQKSDQIHSDSQKSRNTESEKRKSDITRNGHEPETIHIHLSHADSNHPADTRSSQSHDSKRNRDSSKFPDKSEIAPNPHIQNLQNQSGIKRTPSFQKRSESQRRRSMEHLGGSQNDISENTQQTGPQSGTLSDLKKQRAEQHKFGSTDGMVANLFLQSISSDTKKYSSGSNSNPTSQPNNKDKAQNGRASSKPNNNNNPPSNQQRPPTYISDNGPLRKFSAPTSSPVIGEDDKFKNDCCTIL